MIYPWQQNLWQRVIDQYRTGKMPHALLCKGPKGLGKVEFVKSLAETILCERSSSSACGQCRSCTLFLSGNHPDFYEVTLLEKAKQIKIDQIRNLSEKLSLSSHQRGYQVAIIHPAEGMNRASANALLKTLEEPSGQVVIILVADQLALIPATVISRCQTMNFAAPIASDVLEWLKTELDVSQDRAKLLLQMAEGAPKRALNMGQNDYPKFRDQILQTLWQLIKLEDLACKKAPELLKQNLTEVLKVIFSIAMDVMRLQCQLPVIAIENQDCVKALGMMSQKINLVSLSQYLPQLLQAQHRAENIAGLNAQLLLEGVLLRWQGLRGET